MLIGNRIDTLFGLMRDWSLSFKEYNPIMKRSLAMGFISELHQLEQSLKVIDDNLDSEISYEDASINKQMPFLDGKLEIDEIINPNSYYDSADKDSIINHMIDSFPLNQKDYVFSSEKADFLKTGMRQFCSDAAADARDITYALRNGVERILGLLFSINKKKTYIKPYQYENFWYDILGRDDDLIPEEVINDYEQWKEEHDCTDMQDLLDKRTQEILRLLRSGVFSYMKPLKNRDINNSIIKIQEDALEAGEKLPDNIEMECARLSTYVEMKDEIMCLDYTALGKYLYRHYMDIKDESIDDLIYFDYMLAFIHADMVECKPELKVHLEGYEDDQQKEILEKALSIIDTCKPHLNKDVASDFLTNFLTAAYNGDISSEMQAKLKGQSIYTQICRMLGMLKTSLKVFKTETTALELAQSLSTVVKKRKADTLKRYINDGASDRTSKIAKWTEQYIKDNLYTEQERLFAEVAKKKGK